MLDMKVLANEKRRGIFIFLHALMQMPASESNITLITQVTFKFINKTLLVHNCWLFFTQLKILCQFLLAETTLQLEYKIKLSSATLLVNFYTPIKITTLQDVREFEGMT